MLRPQSGDRASPALIEPLLAGGEGLAAARLVERFGMWQRPSPVPSRPRVSLNMVMSCDGLAELEGRSAGLSSDADRALFHALRAATDAVMVGSSTVASEHYGPLVKDPAVRELRRARGLQPEPLACVVSGELSLDTSVPLLHDPQARIVVLTLSPQTLAPTPASVEYVRLGHDGRLDLEACLRELAARFGVARVLCEGGPHLARALFADSLVDELYLSLAPGLAGAGADALPLLPGGPLEPPVALELESAARGGSSLFLRYEVRSRGRV